MARLLPIALVLLCALTALTQPAPKAEKLLIVSTRTGNAEIFLINADGSGAVNLTNNKADDTFPAWSPDGKKIAFTSERDGLAQIFVMEADGTKVTRLTSGKALARAPVWSPDGKQIAFCREDGNGEVFVMNADGGALVNLTNHGAFDGDPAWSPDGKHIAFASNRSDGDGFKLYIMDRDGRNVRELSEKTNPFGYVYPAWSPDGKIVAYTDDHDNALEIFARKIEDKTRLAITKLGGLNTQAAWSPDGKRLAFLHLELEDVVEKTCTLYLSAADGTAAKQVLKRECPVEGGRPSWKPK